MTNKRIFGSRRFLGAAALSATAPRGAVGEQVGRVRGVVTNSVTGEVLEGVTVEATSPALIGAPRITMTDGHGRYELAGLPPGPYTLSFSYPGPWRRSARSPCCRVSPHRSNLDYGLQSKSRESPPASPSAS